MDKLLIEGGKVLSGEVAMSGAKNAALPILCASLLTADPLHLTNVPHLNDISTMLRLLGDMGVGVTMDGVDGMELDGGGLNKERILNKAIERGLVSDGDSLSDREIYNLIFEPGFSTAESVSNLSGRGVGMDVVKREIDSLGGAVSIVSRRGQGSTIFLKIPLTLAIIEGLLVRISQEYYVLPLAPVEACVELDSQAAGSNEGRLMQYRGDLLPYVDLREFFSVPGEAPLVRQVVVVNSQNERIGLVVDTVIGDHQTVIKPLGRMLRGVEGLSGATILGNGTVALIIDHGRIALKVRTGALRGRL